MALDARILIWSIDGIVVARANYNDGDDEWFPQEAISSKEPMVGGSVYRDVAGAMDGTLSFIAACQSYADREAIIGKRGTVVHLQKLNRGYGGHYTLKSVRRVMIASTFYGAAVTFE